MVQQYIHIKFYHNTTVSYTISRSQVYYLIREHYPIPRCSNSIMSTDLTKRSTNTSPDITSIVLVPGLA